MVGVRAVTVPRLAEPRRDLGITTRRLVARRPDWWVYALAGGAGLVAVLPSLAGAARSLGSLGAAGSAHHQHDLAGTSGGPGPIGAGLGSLAALWGWWMVMVVAMMLPVVAPQARRIALRSLWPRRHRAIVGFLAGYLVVWAVIGAVLVGALAALGRPHLPPAAPAAVLVGAAAWQVSGPRRRVLRRCESLRPMAVRGGAADVACATAGWRAGRRCAFTCGPVMLSMAIGHNPLLMGGLLALLLHERARGPNPDRRAGRPLEAAGLVAYAALLTLSTFI
jgi:predicted metal-binding membrane protein